MRKIIVAIDGHSSCGKSTMAKELAKEVGYIYVDTGAMYRAVALFALQKQLFSDATHVDTEALEDCMEQICITFRRDPATGLPQTYLNGENVEQSIRTIEVSEHVSSVATLPFVREAMTRQQQVMGQHRGIVMDGRDIGTVVFPDADLKVFVTAQPEIRAQRRFEELRTKSIAADFDIILRNIKERDYMDSHRSIAPLRQAPDAILLDNSNMSIAQQREWLYKKFQETVMRVNGNPTC